MPGISAKILSVGLKRWEIKVWLFGRCWRLRHLLRSTVFRS
ncbi:hypothetical protein RA263_20115 [Pseudomonas syringae pv. tagetis]|uniref:Uncharacterized protein n=1 Tax=Pseudomonas syringae pv. tagetis TaxID=129140 RepID=A0ABW7NQU2_9PSED|nr:MULTISPECIES: hypothetical protein [Pseudomonas syringae group]UNB71172.1 hypothetical protein MME58_03770 [Pseudomonas syringae pv. tagetis]